MQQLSHWDLSDVVLASTMGDVVLASTIGDLCKEKAKIVLDGNMAYKYLMSLSSAPICTLKYMDAIEAKAVGVVF